MVRGNLSFHFIGTMTYKTIEPNAIRMGSKDSLSELWGIIRELLTFLLLVS